MVRRCAKSYLFIHINVLSNYEAGLAAILMIRMMNAAPATDYRQILFHQEIFAFGDTDFSLNCMKSVVDTTYTCRSCSVVVIALRELASP
jgi:hypothetical protein